MDREMTRARMDMATGAAPREISYSFSVKSRVAKALVRSVENLTGRQRLLRMALGYENEILAGRDFWEVMQERYGITLEFRGGGLENVPRVDPLVIVANHPYGILDGLAMGRVLSATRADFRIIAHVVFRKAKDLQKVVLPIDFAQTREALAQNIETRKEALSYLGGGGAIGIFPSGAVSTAPKPFSKAYDSQWKTFTAKMIARSDAAVVPMYFDGANSRLFQMASHLNQTLRAALLISEFESRVGDALTVTIGRPLPREEIRARARDGRVLMDYLRQSTYSLSPDGARDYPSGLYLG